MADLRPPILLISCEALRADAVGALSGSNPLWPNLRTPNLDDLARQADWVGRGVASSSETLPAIASLLTGLRPWQHQVLHDRKPRMEASIQTVAETLRGLSYETVAYVEGKSLASSRGFHQGFDQYQQLRGGGRTRARLSNWKDDAEFMWIHLADPLPPYPKQGAGAGRRTGQIRAYDLERYRSPTFPIPGSLKKRFLRGYIQRAAILDHEIGRFLTSLRQSGQWDRSLVIVTSAHGEEFGEEDQIGHGNNLSRASLEVPLMIKFPKDLGGRSLEIEAQRIATSRLQATIVDVAGGKPTPATAPTLFDDESRGVISELYRVNGVNTFSLLLGEEQLLREVRFAASSDQYFSSRRRSLGAGEGPWQKRATEQFVQRQDAAFGRTPPFSGTGSAAKIWLRPWNEPGAAQLQEPLLQEEMTAGLLQAWTSFVDQERSPDEEKRWRSQP